jgi:predicted nucleic acid-binding protein
MVYADTSVLVAWFWPEDSNFPAVDRWMRESSPELGYNALQRLELRHNLRRVRGARYGEVAWHGLRGAEASGNRLRGYRVDLPALIQNAELISSQFPGRIKCGAGDLIHVAGAMEADALFVTCDAAQAAAARLVNLKCVLIGE